MSMMEKVIKNVWGLILIRWSTSPIDFLLDPSKALITNSLGFITNPSIVYLDNELFGRMFRDEPVSTNTLDKIVSTHLI